jgi:hypothetical protein
MQMGWIIGLAVIVMFAVIMWAMTAQAKGLGVFEEDKRLNDEADAREGSD